MLWQGEKCEDEDTNLGCEKRKGNVNTGACGKSACAAINVVAY